MGSIVVQEFITLDGVIQGVGGPEEDREGGFDLGGWATDYDRDHDRADEGGPIVVDWESRTEALLLGRKTYEIWAGAWGVWDENADGVAGDFTRRYNRVPKYVASRTLTELSWKNSHLLGADIASDVAKLRDETDGEVRVWGSADFIRTLAQFDLIDEYRLMTYPIVLGAGKKLFDAGFPHSTFSVAETRPLASGMTITTYRRAMR